MPVAPPPGKKTLRPSLRGTVLPFRETLWFFFPGKPTLTHFYFFYGNAKTCWTICTKSFGTKKSSTHRGAKKCACVWGQRGGGEQKVVYIPLPPPKKKVGGKYILPSQMKQLPLLFFFPFCWTLVRHNTGKLFRHVASEESKNRRKNWQARILDVRLSDCPRHTRAQRQKRACPETSGIETSFCTLPPFEVDDNIPTARRKGKIVEAVGGGPGPPSLGGGFGIGGQLAASEAVLYY